MVRFKTRWLLVRLDFESSFGGGGAGDLPTRRTTAPSLEPESKQGLFPSRKEIFFALHDSHIQNFGIAASGEAQDIQVRFSDPHTRLVLIRIPRNDWSKVRATLTLTTSMVRRRVVISMLGIHGSVRTAKRSAIQQVRAVYRAHLKQSIRHNSSSTEKTHLDPQIRKECALLEQTLSTIHAIEF